MFLYQVQAIGGIVVFVLANAMNIHISEYSTLAPDKSV